MSKTLYYRETDPKTGKQKWIKVPGAFSSGGLLFVHQDDWKFFSKSPGIIVYKKR